MEKRINKKIETYITSFKDSIRDKVTSLLAESPHGLSKDKANELLEYVYEYERLVVLKDDLVKRKRIKNSIPNMNRCTANRATGEQCTRRRKDDCEFCGTHMKGTPHGVIHATDASAVVSRKIEVVAKEICGIVYYIDKFNNVYNTEDVMDDKPDPRIIAQYVLRNGVYTIPELGLV